MDETIRESVKLTEEGTRLMAKASSTTNDRTLTAIEKTEQDMVQHLQPQHGLLDLKDPKHQTLDEDNTDMDSDEDNSDGDIDSSSQRGSAMYANEAYFDCDGIYIACSDWLGREYTTHIRKLNSFRAADYGLPLSGMVTELHPWQKSGVCKMEYLAASPFRGGIVGDENGLGKTLMTLVALTRLRDRTPGFCDLIVTPRACVPQWKGEATFNFESSCQPKVLILTSKMTAKDIIESKPDILICTYKYLDLRKRLLSEYDSFHRLAELRGLKWADKLFTEYHRPNPCERVNAGILSPIFRDLGLRIKHVVLDEAQRISNEELSTHASIRELNYYSIFVLSGSFMSNRWHLKPRTSSTDPGKDNFLRNFSGWDGRPSNSKGRRLVKLSQGLVVARPASLLQLPGLQITRCSFTLSMHALVAEADHVREYYEALQKRQSKAALLCAAQAQQAVANLLLIPKVLSDAIERRAVRPETTDNVIAWKTHLDAIELGQQTSGMDQVEIRQRLMQKIRQIHKVPSALASTADDVEMLDASSSEDEDEDDDQTSEEDASDDQISSSDLTEQEHVSDTPEDPDAEGNEELILDDDELDEEFAIQGMEYSTTLATAGRKGWLRLLSKTTDEEIFSSAVGAVLRKLEAIQQNNTSTKVVVFSKFLKFLDILTEAMRRNQRCKTLGIRPLRFDETVSDNNRRIVRQSFASPDDRSPILITPGAGGLGVDLTAASHIILCEPWWNVNHERQAIARCHREGQTETLYVWKMTPTNSMIHQIVSSERDQKSKPIDPWFGSLRRSDHEKPVIPYQYSGGIGE